MTQNVETKSRFEKALKDGFEKLAEQIQKVFPSQKTYVDCAGKEHVFEFNLLGTNPLMLLITAEEIMDDEKEGYEGYRFYMPSELNPFEAFGKLDDKIRKTLSTRYLRWEEREIPFTNEKKRELVPTHDILKGYIASDGLVIDGILIPFEELGAMLSPHDGQEFKFKFKFL